MSIQKYREEFYCDVHMIRVDDGEGCDLCPSECEIEQDEQEVEIWNDRQPIGGFEFGDHEAIFYGE